jgi:hypothetical protein
MERDDLVTDQLARRRLPAGEKAHHLGVAVELKQVVYVVCELAQDQPGVPRMMCM